MVIAAFVTIIALVAFLERVGGEGFFWVRRDIGVGVA